MPTALLVTALKAEFQAVVGRLGTVAWVAPIACGERVVAGTTSAVARLLQKHFSDVVAVEMEGAGFLEAVRHTSKNAIVIRGISDALSGKTEAEAEGSQLLAAANAAAFVFELLDWYQLPPSQAVMPVAPSNP